MNHSIANNSNMDMDEEMIVLSPVAKSTPTNNHATTSNNSGVPAPPRLQRPTLQLQHSYAGHEESFASPDNDNDNVRRAPSGRPFLATRHLSMEELPYVSHSTHTTTSNMMEQQQAQRTTPSRSHHQSQWTLQPSYEVNPHASYNRQNNGGRQNNSLNTNNNNNDLSHSFDIMSDQQAPAFSPGDDAQRQQPPSPAAAEAPQQGQQQGQQQPQPEQHEETAEEKSQREEDESVALAQMLMAEEAMQSHHMSAQFLRQNSDQFSAEDFAALQNALGEEEAEEATDIDGEDEEEVEEMSYEALLQLGERIGDVKTDRWTLIAHKEIAKLETYEYDPAILFKKNSSDDNNNKMAMEDIDDSELKCLVCQFQYEKGDQLRRLPCGHCFHKDCVDQWLQTKDVCAYCRQSICKSDDHDEKK